MKSLAERHADRARRIVANGSEVVGNVGSNIAAAALLFHDAIIARSGLSQSERDALDERLGNLDDIALSPSIAEAQDGTRRTMAGVGVINTKVVPAGIDTPEAGNGGGSDGVEQSDGWGANAAPAATVPTKEGSNLAGEALQDQGAGSNSKQAAKGAKAETKPEAKPDAAKEPAKS